MLPLSACQPISRCHDLIVAFTAKGWTAQVSLLVMHRQNLPELSVKWPLAKMPKVVFVILSTYDT